MPLTPAYTWSENEHSVRITIDGVPIKDQSQLFCSDRLVKLNAPPYLLLLDLKEAVDDDTSTATVLHGRKVVFQLAKANPGLWGSLTAEGDKCIIKQQREESVRRAHEKQVAAQQQRLARKQQEEKAAIDRQIAHERAQRDRIEQLKEQELQQERQQLQQWQEQQQAGGSDESDYEDDLAIEEALAGRAATDGLQEHSLQDGSLQEAMPDHPDYHGRGWKPHTATSAEAGQSDKQLEQQQHQTGSKDNNNSSSGGGGEAGVVAPELVMLTAGGNSNQATSAISALLSDAAAAATGQGYTASSDGSNNSSTSTGRETCSLWSTYSSASAAVDGSDQLLTVRSSSSTAITPAAVPAPAVVPRTRLAPPAKPLASVRSRAAPVAVSFTQLSTPHLPAREQREVELKDIKRHAKADSLDVSERQPAFLKDKGNALAAQGNYRGAINAYTRALELQSKQPSLWSNRAACHLALGQAAECLQDCSAAVKLLQAAHTQLRQTAGQPGAEQELLAGLLPAAAAAGAGTAGQQPAQGEVEATASGIDGGEQQQELTALEAAAGKDVSSNSSCGAALKLQRQLAKVLARRAAAHVELQLLQEASEDLHQALRYDPGNAQLQADALELSAALNPDAGTTPASLKERADARFKAGDLEGAAEAYTAVVQLVQQQQQQTQQQQQQQGEVAAAEEQQQQYAAQLLAALSNRAACWLPLEEYSKCIEDCQAALVLALAGPQARQDAAVATSAATADSAASTGAAAAAEDSMSDVAAEAAVGDDDLSLREQSTVAEQCMLHLLQRQSPEQLLAVPSAGLARVRSIARLLSRLAVAHGCLKNVQHAVQLYECAQQWWLAVGDEQRAAEMAADQQRLQQLLPATQAA